MTLKKIFAKYNCQEYDACLKAAQQYLNSNDISEAQRKVLLSTIKLCQSKSSNFKQDSSKAPASTVKRLVYITQVGSNELSREEVDNILNNCEKSDVLVDSNYLNHNKSILNNANTVNLFVSPSRCSGLGSLNFALMNSLESTEYDIVKVVLPCQYADTEDFLEFIAETKLNYSFSSGYLEVNFCWNRIESLEKGFFLPFVFHATSDAIIYLAEYFNRSPNQPSKNKSIFDKYRKLINSNAFDKPIPEDINRLIELVHSDNCSKTPFCSININNLNEFLSITNGKTNLHELYEKLDISLFIDENLADSIGETNLTGKLTTDKIVLNSKDISILFDNSIDYDYLPAFTCCWIDYDYFMRKGYPPLPICFIYANRNTSTDININRLSNAYASDETIKASVLMSYYNKSQNIWYSLFSLATQKFKNFELLIGSDESTEDELQLLYILCSLYPGINIRILAMPRNIGTYGVRNYLAIKALSPCIIINDADDFSLSSRLRESIFKLYLDDSSEKAFYSQHLRVSSVGQSLAAVKNKDFINAKKIRPAMASYAYQKQLHNEYGFFYPYRKGCDSEFNNRLPKELIHRSAKILLLQMFVGTTENLTKDMFKLHCSEAYASYYEVNESSERRKIATSIEKNKDNINIFRPNISTRSGRKVVGNMATIPKRNKTLSEVLQTILPQVDELNLYLNDYSADYDLYQDKPELLKFKDKILIYFSSEIGDRREHARFHKALKYNSEWYYACFDDDIIYPTDYINKLVLKCQIYNNLSIMCVHGYSLWSDLLDFTSDPQRQSRYYHFKKQLAFDTYVDVPGVGTLFSPAELISDDFYNHDYGFNDLVFSKYVLGKQIKIVCIDRESNWIKEIKYPESLYSEAKQGFNKGQIFAQEHAKNYWDKFNSQSITAHQSDLSLISDERALCSLPNSSPPLYILANGQNVKGNAIRFTDSLVQALANVNYPDINIHLLIDKSSDGSKEAFEKQAYKFARYKVSIKETDTHIGPAIARMNLLNNVRIGDKRKKLIAMLDLDDYVLPLFGRYVHQIINTGFCRKIYCGGWRFNSSKRIWPHKHGETGEKIEKLFQLPFSWGHPRLWWEDTPHLINNHFLTIGDQTLMYCSDIGFLQALNESFEEENYFISRSFYPIYKYIHDSANGTIAKWGKNKKITAQYLLMRGLNQNKTNFTRK